MKKKNFKKLLAFTLAEVLITLSILGVVAAITVPSLVKRNEEKSTVAKVLKAYSTLSHAADVAIAENGTMAKFLANEGILGFYKYLNTTKICPTGGDECYLNDYPVAISGKKDYWMVKGWPSARLKDGSAISANISSLTCSGSGNGFDYPDGCAQILYDVNGPKKGPNKIGWDIFAFVLSPKGVAVPKTNSATACLKSNSDVHGGKTCVDYILKNKNMNYLHE